MVQNENELLFRSEPLKWHVDVAHIYLLLSNFVFKTSPLNWWIAKCKFFYFKIFNFFVQYRLPSAYLNYHLWI